MEDLKVKIEHAVAVITKVTTLFYQNRSQEAYLSIDEMLLGLQQVADLIFAYKEHLQKYDEQKFVGILSEALQALESKDTSLFSDLLQYEIVEILENIKGDAIKIKM